MTPRKARTDEQIAALPRDNVETADHWFMVDGEHVILTAQQMGELPTAKIIMPRATFEAFMDWYNTGKYRRPRKRKAPSQGITS